MNARREYLPEMIALCAAGMLLLVSLLWWHARRGLVERLRGASRVAVLTGRPYTQVTWSEPDAPNTWERPPLRKGAAWGFDLFTPETVYYHAVSGLFTMAPVKPVDREGTAAFGLELLDVQRERFRMQLVGYAGRPADLRAIMENPVSGEMFVARRGARFGALALSLEAVELRKVGAGADVDPSTPETAAVAILHDELTDERVTLSSNERKYTDVPLARLYLKTAGRPLTVREGDLLTAADATFRVERIRLDPPEVVVTKQTVGSAPPEIRILTPTAVEKDLANRPPSALRRDNTSIAAARP